MSEKRLPLVYIAGPFRGATPLDVRRNVEAARDLGLRVAQAGGYPVIPHTMTAEFDKQLDDQFWLDGTMEMLRRCDAICCTWNWQMSHGARAEVEEAARLERPTWYDAKHDQAYSDIMLGAFMSGLIDHVNAQRRKWPATT